MSIPGLYKNRNPTVCLCSCYLKGTQCYFKTLLFHTFNSIVLEAPCAKNMEHKTKAES